MIKSAVIENFKCFKRLELPDLAPITIIGGENNVGKTALLEALFLFFDRYNIRFSLNQYARRGINVGQIDAENLWGPLFAKYDLQKPISIELTDDKTATEKLQLSHFPWVAENLVKISANVQDSASTPPAAKSGASPVSALELYFLASGIERRWAFVLRPEGVVLQPPDLQDRSVPVANWCSDRVRMPPDELLNRFGALDVHGRKDELLEIVKTLETRLIDLSIVVLRATPPYVHGDIGLGRKIPISYMGGGLVKLLDIALAINNDGYLFIDEIENGLHHTVQARVFGALVKAAKKANCQVFTTTHSYEFLTNVYEGLPEDCQGDFRYIRLDRQGEKTTAMTFNYEELGVALDANMEIR